MSRDRKEKVKEEKTPRLNVPSKRIKAAHRAHLKFAFSEDGDKQGLSLKTFANNEAWHDGKYKEAADAWFLNKLEANG